MAAGDVRTDDVIAIIDAVARKAPTTADRVQTAVASVFSWAVRERIVAFNPARGITKRTANIPRDRVPNDADLRLILEGIYSACRPAASPDLRDILHVLLLTGTRSSRSDLPKEMISNGMVTPAFRDRFGLCRATSFKGEGEYAVARRMAGKRSCPSRTKRPSYFVDPS